MISVFAVIWFYLLGFILVLYIMLDGFDLGVGIISLFTRGPQKRAIMMSSLSTVWDANETWLVIWGGALFGAFPLAYATAASALYVPFLLLLLSLIFRGVSFEFHGHSSKKSFWTWAFGLGSLFAAISEGLILGGALAGIPVDSKGVFRGGAFDWFHISSLVIVLEVVCGFVMLGSTYLVMKTEEHLQNTIRITAIVSSCVTFIFAVATAFLIPYINRSFAKELLLVGKYHDQALIIFGISAFFFISLLVSLFRGRQKLPFIFSLLVFFVTFGGLWLGAYPYLLPGSVTVQMAASNRSTLIFMLAGIGPIIPVILLYNFYVYHVFRGKVGGDGGGYD